MPNVYGYLRISTDKQNIDNNKAEILLKANELKLQSNVIWLEWIWRQCPGQFSRSYHIVWFSIKVSPQLHWTAAPQLAAETSLKENIVNAIIKNNKINPLFISNVKCLI